MWKTLFVATFVLGGCGKKSDTASSAPSCAEAVGKAVGAMPAGPTGGEVQTKLKAVMTTRCTEDKWPAAALNCYATSVTDMASMKKCREQLTQDQQTKLMTDIRNVMMGAAGAGGGPMHGASDPATGSATTAAPTGSAAETGSSN